MRDIRLPFSGGTIAATEHIAPNATATALVLHGFYSNRQSGNVKAAVTRFVDKGLNVLAPDFYGRGDSDGAFGDLTVARGVATVSAAIDHIKHTHPDTRIVLTGGSFGGLVALHAAADLADAIALLILRAPVSRWGQVWSAQLTPDQFQSWSETGSFSAPLPWGDIATFGRDFYNDLMRDDVSDTVAPRIAVPTLVIHGTADEVVPLSQSEMLTANLKNAELIALDGADHGFTRPADLARYQDEIDRFLSKYIA